MNEVLVKYATEFMEAIKAGAYAIGKELPVVAKQILTYKASLDIFWLCFLALLVAGAFTAAVLLWRAAQRDIAKKGEGRSSYAYSSTGLDDVATGIAFQIAITIAAILLVIFLIAIPFVTLDLIKIKTAPDLYLLEYLKNFLR